MGLCHGKPIQNPQNKSQNLAIPGENEPVPNSQTPKSSNFPFYSPSPLPSLFKNSPAVNSSVSSTPLRIFKRPFPPPSPAKHIRALLARRHGSVKPNEASIPEGDECEIALDKNFGYSKQFVAHYELGEEVGRGHFGFTCSAKAKKGSLKGQDVAVKVIPKSKVCCFSFCYFDLAWSSMLVTMFICLISYVNAMSLLNSSSSLIAYVLTCIHKIWLYMEELVEAYEKFISNCGCS